MGKNIAMISIEGDRFILNELAAVLIVNYEVTCEFFSEYPPDIDKYDGIIVYGYGYVKYDYFLPDIIKSTLPCLYIYTFTKPPVRKGEAVGAPITVEDFEKIAKRVFKL
jgi:hypothetical protein